MTPLNFSVRDWTSQKEKVSTPRIVWYSSDLNPYLSVFALAQESAKKTKKWYEESDLNHHWSFFSTLPSWLFFNSWTNLEYIVMDSCRNISADTHHLTLAHKPSSTNIKAKMCGLPDVTNASMTKTKSNATNAPSKMFRNAGFRDEPGWSMVPMKSSCSVVDMRTGKGTYLLVLITHALFISTSWSTTPSFL